MGASSQGSLPGLSEAAALLEMCAVITISDRCVFRQDGSVRRGIQVCGRMYFHEQNNKTNDLKTYLFCYEITFLERRYIHSQIHPGAFPKQ